MCDADKIRNCLRDMTEIQLKYADLMEGADGDTFFHYDQIAAKAYSCAERCKSMLNILKEIDDVKA